jgi:hypothetical protein
VRRMARILGGRCRPMLAGHLPGFWRATARGLGRRAPSVAWPGSVQVLKGTGSLRRARAGRVRFACMPDTFLAAVHALGVGSPEFGRPGRPCR